MSRNYKIKLNFVLFFVSALIGGFNFVFAREININNTPSASLLPGVTIQKIRYGINLLKSSPALIYETIGKNLKGDLARKQIALAILNINTGEIFEKRVWVKEKDIKNYRKTGVITLEPAVSGDPLDVRVQWWNSFNSFYYVTDRPEFAVIADKYLLPSRDLSNLPEKSKNKYTDIIYVPYSKALHLPEIVDAGKDYLEQNIDWAYKDLELNGVISHSSPGVLVTSGVSEDFIRNIILVEHVDPDNFNFSNDGGRELTERALVLIGTNQQLAYRYTGSPAGASGLAQFIKATYKSVVSSYPEAHLIKDYSLGMADHVNAIKAMVLFFDSRKLEISKKIVRSDILQSLGISEEMLAAAYNGGGGKVVKSVNKFGFAWISGQLNLPSSRRIFKKETLNYIQKFQSIRDLNLFANLSDS